MGRSGRSQGIFSGRDREQCQGDMELGTEAEAAGGETGLVRVRDGYCGPVREACLAAGTWTPAHCLAGLVNPADSW